MNILAIIPTFNRVDLLARLLESLNSVQSPEFDVLIIDDGSDDDYSGLIAKKFNFHIHYIKKLQNLGLQDSYVWALNYAETKSYQFAWILDDDSVVECSALKHLLSGIEEKPDIAAAGSAIYNIDDPSHLICVGGKINFADLEISPVYSKSYVDVLANCSVLINLSIIKKSNVKFDKNYWLRNDDADFYYSLKESGYNILSVPQSVIYHRLWSEAGSQMAYYDRRNFCYAGIKFEPDKFAVKLKLLASIKSYWCGNFLNSLINYFALNDLSNGTMGKRDFYGISKLKFISKNESFINKKILFINLGSGASLDCTVKMLNKFCADADFYILSSNKESNEFFPRQTAVFLPSSLFSRIIMYLKSIKKYDYIAIGDNGINNIVFPWLAKKSLKADIGGLAVKDIGVIDFFSFSFLMGVLILKIWLREFQMDRWRSKLKMFI